MVADGEGRPTTETDIDAILAAEAGMSVEELREQGDVEFTVPWESEIVGDHEE